MSKILLLQIIYWGSFLVAYILLRRTWRAWWRGRIFMFLIWGFISACFIWGRFVEPYQIELVEDTIDLGIDKNIALISDMHLGVYKDRKFLQRVVNQINKQEDLDMVLIAGDFTYEPREDQDLRELFLPLGDLKVPVYAVLGNHDVERPGPDLRNELIKALEYNSVQILHNDLVAFDDFLLLGLGPHLSGEDDVEILKDLHPVNKVIVLTHNPDTVTLYPNNNADLTLVGHTHCGQIRPPFLFPLIKKAILPVVGDFDCGASLEERTRLYITPGIGEVMLPIRFGVRPRIDVIRLQK